MPLVNLTLTKPHPAQAVIKGSPARFKVLNCGRRFGKTELAKEMLLEYVIRGYPVAYFAPSYKMTKSTWREVKYTARELITRPNETEGRMEFMTRGAIDFWSLSTTSAESVRGRKYKFIVMDEAAMVMNGLAVWNEVIRPLLVDFHGGALFSSTPRGRNWFFDLHQLGQDPLRPEWASWSYPTVANPYISPDEVEAARLTTPERSFRQEYLAEFVEDAGSVFRNVSEVSVLEPNLAGYVTGSGHRYVMGVDWGRDVDFTAVSVYNATTHEQVFLDRFNQVGYALQRGRLRTLVDRYKPELILAEENSIGTVNIEELQRDGLPVVPFYTSYASKGPLIDSLAIAIEQKRVKLLNDPVQKHELQAYTLYRTPNGMYVYTAPQGGHDDTVIALALSLQAAQSSVGISMRQAEVHW